MAEPSCHLSRWFDPEGQVCEHPEHDITVVLDDDPPWKQQPPCEVCHEQHAGYEAAHI